MQCVVICVTDSPTAGKVVRTGLRCARAIGVPARFLHVGELEEARRERLVKLIEQSRHAPPDVDVEVDVGAHPGGVEIDIGRGRGGVADIIRVHAQALDARLIVIGALERERALRDLVGSTARRVAMRASCAVLLVSTAARDVSIWSRYVIAVDLDDAAADLAECMLAIAREGANGGEPQIAFAHETSAAGEARGYERPHTFPLPVEPAVHLPAEQHLLAEFIKGMNLQGVRATGVTLIGQRGYHAARFAQESEADLLGVVAPPEPLGFFDRFFSHPAVVIMEKLPCSVLLYRGESIPG